MTSSSPIPERVKLAESCASRDWPKAITALTKLLDLSCTVQDLCNRAFCYSKLELYNHVIKDCKKAIELDPSVLQAYILQGNALSSLGKKADALLVWEEGYGHALRQSADLKQLLELEELLNSSKEERNAGLENVVNESRSSATITESASHTNGQSNEISGNQNKLCEISSLCRASEDASDILRKIGYSSEVINGVRDEAGGKSPIPISDGRPYTNGKSDEIVANDKLTDKSELCSELRGTSEICSILGDNFGSQNNSCRKAEGDFKADESKIHDVLDKANCDSQSSTVSSDKSDVASQLPTLSITSGDTDEIRVKLSNKTDTPITEASDETKKSKKICVTRVSKTKSITVDFRLSRGIAQVNEGKYASAISIFDQILRDNPTYSEALIGRGTAHAFQRELNPAIHDFSRAIESNPLAGEAWKRRGQARAALGQSVEAIQDLTKALEFEPNSPDILHERGIVNFKFKDFGAAVEDLSTCVTLDKNNKSAYTYLGLALSSIGEFKKAEEAHLKSIQLDQNFLEGWAHITQFYQDLANSNKALECIEQALQIDKRFAKGYHLRGLLHHGLGEHRKAIEELSEGLKIENSNIECLYLRASCYHAIGEYAEAVKDYDMTLDMELDSMEKFVLQCLAFYQKELALYTASKISYEFFWFDIDGDIDPLFKEYWCKRSHPKNVCEKVFRQPPLKKSKLKKLDFPMTKQKTALLMAADSVGKKIQYDCPGFLPNRRQHRMAGLAAIEIAQKVSKAWRSLQSEWRNTTKSTSKYGKRPRRRVNMPSQNRGGAGCSTSSSAETSTSYSSTEERSSGRHAMSWHDVYSFAVKWRQISEPCDPVVWVNKLSEEFNTGFGSHTPLILGQAKVVRYYPNYERTLEAAKTIVKDKLYVHDKADEVIAISKDKLEDIMEAKTCSDLYKLIGEDFWLATWCNSTAIEGKRLEGTRITLVKMGEHGFDFAIRTPCTPSRWDEFDAEMATAWEAVCNAYCGENFGSTDFDVLENVRNAILRMTYYWYNFMPLSRGSAAVGFTVLLGLLLAANMEFEGAIPKGLQVDWEAILNFEPSSFVDSVKSWLYPSLKVTTSWKDYPDVQSTFSTIGSVVAALSTYND